MALKIEKTSPALFATPRVETVTEKKRDTEQGKQQPQQEKREERRPAEPKDVERAIEELRQTGSFTQTGMRVEMLTTKNGLMVQLTNAIGVQVKTMTSEEFLELRESSDGESVTRGKILDQKL